MNYSNHTQLEKTIKKAKSNISFAWIVAAQLAIAALLVRFNRNGSVTAHRDVVAIFVELAILNIAVTLWRQRAIKRLITAQRENNPPVQAAQLLEVLRTDVSRVSAQPLESIALQEHHHAITKLTNQGRGLRRGPHVVSAAGYKAPSDAMETASATGGNRHTQATCPELAHARR